MLDRRRLRIDGGVLRAEASLVLRGADAVARHTATYAKLYPFVRAALVNGAAGAVVAPPGRVFSATAFTVTNEKIAQIDVLLDPARLEQLDLRIRPTAANTVESAEENHVKEWKCRYKVSTSRARGTGCANRSK